MTVTVPTEPFPDSAKPDLEGGCECILGGCEGITTHIIPATFFILFFYSGFSSLYSRV